MRWCLQKCQPRHAGHVSRRGKVASGVSRDGHGAVLPPGSLLLTRDPAQQRTKRLPHKQQVTSRRSSCFGAAIGLVIGTGLARRCGAPQCTRSSCPRAALSRGPWMAPKPHCTRVYRFARPLIRYRQCRGHRRSMSGGKVSHIPADHRAKHLEGHADSDPYVVSRPVGGQQGGREVGI
jgi:hypothetical protein